MNLFRPWSARRLIAVDPGSRCVKLLLAEATGSGLAMLDCRLVDLQEEGLLAAEEIQRHLAEIIREWEEWPIALTLPAQASFSQVLDLAGAGESGIPKVIEEQTSRLRGLSGSALVYDFAALDPSSKWQQPYFVTLAREEDVTQHLKRVTAVEHSVCAVSGLANALIRAHEALQPELKHTVLVDFGATTTTVVVVHHGQGVFASTYASGSRALVEALAKARKLSEPEAEALLRSGEVQFGKHGDPAVWDVLDRWLVQLRSQLEDLRAHRPELLPTGPRIPVVLSGGALRWSGLLDRLETEAGFSFVCWPEMPRIGSVQPGRDFIVAYGTALDSLPRQPEKPSLLPPALRTRAKSLRQAATLSVACAGFLVFLALLLTFATWQKYSLWSRKQVLIRQGETALTQVEQFEKLTRDRDRAFEQFAPLLDQEERMYGLLHVMRALQQARAQNEFWCVLLADAESYARAPIPQPAGSNQVAVTALPIPPEENLAKLAFIVELCVPAGGDQTAKVLSEVVVGLRKNPLFSRVDSLPAAQRRALVDPKVVIPDRHFALSMDLADLGWRNLLHASRSADASSGTSTNANRRSGSSLFPRTSRAPVPYVPPGSTTNQPP